MAEIYKELIPFEFTGVLNKTVKDYYSGAEALKKFYQYTPDIQSIEKVIADRKAFPFNRAVLNEVISQQYLSLIKASHYDVTGKQIELLNSENTFTVTTAHQPNLLLGPLYYIYKIASTIKLSQLLKEKYPAYNFIPVFWMGSEDHDTEELAHINLFGKKIEWKTSHEGPFGLKSLQSIGEFKSELQSVLGSDESAAKAMKMLDEYYFNENNITSATRKLLHHLFGEFGLVIVDGNDKELKKIFSPIVKDELLNQTSFKLVSATIKELEQAGYAAQAQPREINLFYLDNETRQRIVLEDSRYKALNTDLSFSKDEILNLLQTNPEKLSPNVILRPLYQEIVLPNIAFIGGGAELSYFMQLKSLFEYHKVHFPMLLLRDIVLLLHDGVPAYVQKLGFELKDFFGSKEELIKKYLATHSEDGLDLNPVKDLLKDVYQKLDASAKQADTSLSGAVQAELTKTLKGVEAIEDKMRKAEKKKNETGLQKIEKIKDKFFPNNTFQERYTNFLEYYLIYEEDFIPSIINNINLFDQGVKVLTKKA